MSADIELKPKMYAAAQFSTRLAYWTRCPRLLSVSSHFSAAIRVLGWCHISASDVRSERFRRDLKTGLLIGSEQQYEGTLTHRAGAIMSSLVSQYHSTKAELERLQAQLEALQSSEGLKAELQFVDDLKALMEMYSKKPVDVVAAIAPQYLPKSAKPAQVETARRARRVKLYINPHTNEHLETKGGNNTVLKQWKSQYGADAVESWATIKD